MCVCHRNNHTPVESDQEGTGVRSEEEDEWVYPERRVSKKARREKVCYYILGQIIVDSEIVLSWRQNYNIYVHITCRLVH